MEGKNTESKKKQKAKRKRETDEQKAPAQEKSIYIEVCKHMDTEAILKERALTWSDTIMM